MKDANVIEMIGAVFTGLIAIGLAAVIFKPNSTAPKFLSAAGSAFATSVTAAEGGAGAIGK